MKEYCIYIKHGSASPFRMFPYLTYELAKQALLNMISDFEYRGKIYYIDNDFYENKFPLGLQGSTYYQIQEREVWEWKKYETRNTNEIYCKTKILKFHK